MNDSSLNTLIHLSIEGRISDDDRATLERMLRESAAARQQYVRELDTHASLQWCFRGKNPAQATTAQPSSGMTIWRWSALAAAACVLLAAMLWMNRPMNPAPEPQRASTGTSAVLAESRGALWAEDSVYADLSQLGEPLPLGPVALDWGVAQLMFEQGAVVQLRGPARMIITGPNSAELVEGQLQAYVPQRARGFTVIGPGGTRVTDLGTEFVMQAERGGAVRVDVIEGRVQLATTQNTAGRLLAAGFSATMSGDGRITSTDYDPELPRRFQIAADQLYEQRLMSDNPLAYWPLTVDGSCGGRVKLPLQTPGLNIQKPGLHDTAGAARLDHGVGVASGNVTALRIDGPMTLEAWVRLDTDPEPDSIMRLISLDDFAQGGRDRSGWGLALRGRDMLRFTHYGVRDYDLRIDPLPLRRWVHLAIVIDADRKIDFYTDGEFRGAIAGQQSPQYGLKMDLTVGSLGDGRELYTQLMAHLAVYDRAITPREISEHYRIGRPR